MLEQKVPTRTCLLKKQQTSFYLVKKLDYLQFKKRHKKYRAIYLIRLERSFIYLTFFILFVIVIAKEGLAPLWSIIGTIIGSD